jgi:hypothetical protein
VNRRVLIFGCGPSGLLVAHAAAQAGWGVAIVSVKRPSQLFGCQYLHAEIPDVPTGDPVDVTYKLTGTPLEYAEKVYGPDRPVLMVSPSTLVGTHPAWDIRKAYRWLWEAYSGYVVNEEVSAQEVPDIVKYYQPDLTLSTLPAPALCSDPTHRFDSVLCWAIGDAPELGQKTPYTTDPFTVLCDASKDRGYYRISNVFGYSTVEWPGWRRKPPVDNVVGFHKPLRTDCDCLPEVVRAGRMGKWQKGVLAHETYQEAVGLFSA